MHLQHRNPLFVFLLAGFLLPLQNFAQSISATANADTNAILIGSQFHIDLQVSHPAAQVIEWPTLPDTFNLFEIVNRSPVDTINIQGQSVTRHQQFTITSFDSGFHVIPPLVVRYRLQGDTSVKTAETLPLLISVSSVPVDTTKAIKDLKSQVNVPWTWKDFLPFILGAIVIILLSYLIYRYLDKRKKKVKAPVIKVRERPAHELALEELEKLKEKKLWQQGLYKEYYTELSDIIRIFIERSWNIPAMEMTTDEIMHLQVISRQDKSVSGKLEKLLTFSDLVKFAKAVPVSIECEQSMDQAIDFVDANRIESERKAESI